MGHAGVEQQEPVLVTEIDLKYFKFSAGIVDTVPLNHCHNVI